MHLLLWLCILSVRVMAAVILILVMVPIRLLNSVFLATVRFQHCLLLPFLLLPCLLLLLLLVVVVVVVVVVVGLLLVLEHRIEMERFQNATVERRPCHRAAWLC